MKRINSHCWWTLPQFTVSTNNYHIAVANYHSPAFFVVHPCHSTILQIIFFRRISEVFLPIPLAPERPYRFVNYNPNQVIEAAREQIVCNKRGEICVLEVVAVCEAQRKRR